MKGMGGKPAIAEIDCVICGDITHGVCLHPCGHTEMCPACTYKITESGCPLCRAEIEEVVICPERTKYLVHDIVTYKNKEEAKALSNVPQIVVVGSDNSGKELFTQVMRDSFSLLQECPAPSFPGFENRFAANLSVFGTNIRITKIPCSNPEMYVHEEIARLKADALVICASTDGRNLYRDFKEWSDAVSFLEYTRVILVAMPGHIANFCNVYSWNSSKGLVAGIPSLNWHNHVLLHLPYPDESSTAAIILNESRMELVQCNIERTAKTIKSVAELARKNAVFSSGL